MSPSEIALRTAAVFGLLLLAGLLIAARRRDPACWLGTLSCLGAVAFVLTSIPGAGAVAGPWLTPLVALCVTKAVWFWLFARGLFREEFRVTPRHLAFAATVAVYGVWQQQAFVPDARAGLASGTGHAASLGFDALIGALVILALMEAWRGLASDLVERRRRLRVLFVAVTGAYLGIAVCVQAYNLLLDARTPQPLVLANLGLMVGLSLLAASSLVQLRSTHWLAPDRRHPSSGGMSAAELRVLAALEQALGAERIYREEGLTIGRLAARLGTREHVLRRVINRGLGYRNFNDFLHAYRIREACVRLRRPEDAGLPVLTIALDVGYSTIGPFNRAFRSRIGMTPTRFRRDAGGGQPA
jgi:AraC-like DNA-binding protein